MNLRKRFALARRVYSLTVQLRAKSAELHAAHRRIDALTEGRCEDADLRAERLRAENEELRRANARLAVAAGGLEAELKKQLEGNPS